MAGHSWYPLIALFAFACLAGASGCTHYLPAAVSSASLDSKHQTPVAVVSGKSSADYFLFFGPFGDDSLRAAVEQAKIPVGADSLVNVFVDRSMTCFPHCAFPLYMSVTTSVTGTAVVYDIPLRPAPDKTAISKKSTGLETPAENYSRLLLAFQAGPRQAEILHEPFPRQAKDSLYDYVAVTKSDGSPINWKLKRPATEQERIFLKWYVSTFTEHVPTFE